MSSDGERPPGGKPPLSSATIVGMPMQQPGQPAQQPPAQQPPAQQPPAQQPPAKRSTLPPPIRGPHQPAPPQRPSGPTPSAGYQPSASQPPVAQPPVAQPPVAQPPPQAPPPQAPPPQAPPPPAFEPFAPAQSYGQQPSAHQPSGQFSGQHAAPLPQAYVHSPSGYSPDVPPGASFDSIEAPGSKFIAFLKISARRAFRLRIEPSEVLPSERRTLESSSPPILDRNLQAFLAWRRSVLFLVASALIPLTIIGVIDALQSRKFTPIFFVRGAPALAEGIFAWVCWSQLKKWSSWRAQRRKLFFGWLLFMLMPFVVFIYPLRTIFESLGGTNVQKLSALGIEGAYRQAVMPFVFAMLAMLQLAPKAISLMPGLIRASLVIKLLFPGSSAPGWLMVVAAPLYALLAYVILIIPYQFTGSGYFIAGVLGVIAAQSVLARAGFALATPMDEAEAMTHIKKVRRYYMAVMVVSGILIVVALSTLVAKLNLRWTDVVTAVLKFETNVLILTMIGADLVVTNLDRARNYTAGRGHVEEQTEVKIAAFVSLDAPSTPPPAGPAQ